VPNPGRDTPDRVPDDLWSPYGPGSFAHLGAQAGRLRERSERERARGTERAERLQRERAEREQAHAARREQDRTRREPGRARRGRARDRATPPLSRAQIVDAAIAVADAEGSDAVSMRRIAQVLRAGTMSLYWHVANKEHLLDLMLDALIADVEVPEPSGDWRADLRALASNYRAMLLRHLWMMDFVGGRPPLGPNTMLNLDRSLALLDDAGPDVPTAMNVLSTLLTYVLGAVLREAREVRVQRAQDRAEGDPAEWEPARAAWRDRLDADGRFTHVVRFLDAGYDPDAEETRDERFEFGLDCLLDGLAARVPGARAEGPVITRGLAELWP
jgi:AcrR family transcriptional regulator